MQLFAYLQLLIAALLTYAQQCPPGFIQSSVHANQCYLIVAHQKEIWSDAASYCQRAAPGAHLASICSAFENSNVNTIVSGTSGLSAADELWIGLNDINALGQFVWNDGNSCSYRNWLQGEPYIGASAQCVTSAAKSTGKWVTKNCGTRNYFICEYIQNQNAGTDCLDLYNAGNKKNGIYSINPPGLPAAQVYCEMETDGGGWTVFQRRLDNNLVFYDRTWNEFKRGFNNGLENSLWLGNDILHALSTKDPNVGLRIDIWGDRSPHSANPNIYLTGKYANFSIDSEEKFYTFHVAYRCNGNASLPDIPTIWYNNGRKFSTVDVNHDVCDGCCSAKQQLGLDYCTWISLNGKYVPPTWNDFFGFSWTKHAQGVGYDYMNPARSRMMLRKF